MNDRNSRDTSRSTRGRDDDRGSSRGGREERGGRGRDDDRGGRGGRGSPYVYQRRDPDSAKKRAEHSGGDFDVYLNSAIKTFKANDRDNTIRLLPPTWPEAEHFGLDIWLHYRIGPDKQSYLCLHKMKGEPCPICDERARALKLGDEQYAKDLAPTRRVLAYLLDRDAPREGVQAWAMPQSLDQNITKVSVDKRTGEVLPIDHPEEGFDVMFEKKGAQQKTEYLGVQIARRDSPLDDPDAMAFAVDHPLPDQLIYYSYDHILQVFGGAGSGGGRRDRDPEPSRDDDRGRDRDRGGRDERDDRGRGSERDDDRGGRGSRSRDPDAVTWDSVHAMTGRELEDLIELERLDINPSEAKDDADLADWICEEMKLSKPAPAARSRERVAPEDDGAASDRLARMRQERR